jgi:hypothetical protein
MTASRRSVSSRQTAAPTDNKRPSPAELLTDPEAFLLRTDLTKLGLNRRAVDSAFRNCPVIALPGYDRPMIRVRAFLAFIEGATYCDKCGDRVRPSRNG